VTYTHCSGGEKLHFSTHKHTERTRVGPDQAPATACNASALKYQCTDSAKWSQFTHTVNEDNLERVGRCYATRAH
jgi:hypothetical protein